MNVRNAIYDLPSNDVAAKDTLNIPNDLRFKNITSATSISASQLNDIQKTDSIFPVNKRNKLAAYTMELPSNTGAAGNFLLKAWERSVNLVEK